MNYLLSYFRFRKWLMRRKVFGGKKIKGRDNLAARSIN